MKSSTLKTSRVRAVVCGAAVALVTSAVVADAAAQAPTTYRCTVTLSPAQLRCVASPVQPKRSSPRSTSRHETCVLVRTNLYYVPWRYVCGPSL
jgi:hypothetical protein